MEQRPPPPDPGVKQRVGNWGDIVAVITIAVVVLLLIFWPN